MTLSWLRKPCLRGEAQAGMLTWTAGNEAIVQDGTGATGRLYAISRRFQGHDENFIVIGLHHCSPGRDVAADEYLSHRVSGCWPIVSTQWRATLFRPSPTILAIYAAPHHNIRSF